MASEILIPDFQLVEDLIPRRRLVIGVDGRDKHGKTHFCLTAPSPIGYLDFDMGSEGMVEKFQQGFGGRKPKVIGKSRPFIVKPPEVLEKGEDADKIAEAEWTRFHSGYLQVLREPFAKINKVVQRARSLIVDTGSETYELLRLAKFGKLVQVPTFKYRETNAIMRDLVRHALDSDVNVMFIHKLSAEWKASGVGSDGKQKQSKTGVYERKGFEEMAHLVQANVFAYRAPLFDSSPATWKIKVGTGEADVWVAEPRDETGDLGFRLRVLNSRHNPALEGIELQNEMIDFSILAQLMVPDSIEEDWTDT